MPIKFLNLESIDWTLGPKCDHRIWPWPLLWPWIFNVRYEICYNSTKTVRLLRNEKQLYRLNCKPQMWPSDLTLTMTLTLNFQGQIWNLLYLSEQWSGCHATESKLTDWTQGLNCDHQIWPWPWPWPSVLKFKYQICYISNKMVRLPRNEKQTYRLNSRARMWPLGLTLPWPWPCS